MSDKPANEIRADTGAVLFSLNYLQESRRDQGIINQQQHPEIIVLFSEVLTRFRRLRNVGEALSLKGFLILSFQLAKEEFEKTIRGNEPIARISDFRQILEDKFTELEKSVPIPKPVKSARTHMFDNKKAF